jgi:hypothetical protein
MIGAGVTIVVVGVVVAVVVVGFVVPPTIVAALVVALRIGAPNIRAAFGELTRAFNLVVSFAKDAAGVLSSLAVVTVY